MSKIETGGPSFPSEHWSEEGAPVYEAGLTLRDYFAAKALAGELASSSLHWGEDLFALVATNAYSFADAMLEARK